ncbi:tectonic-2 isoform X2 [Scyliorhinus canicula]|uniref:tectonic-2 isoform X2 n=1 Tax=Scyliorhinus canicula TaxID=7830 RepID=UPI0018F6C6E5|nr:tectonic-2 isoform X2 [Scyliorhinus canicula]
MRAMGRRLPSPAWILLSACCSLLLGLGRGRLVFQPSFLIASGPEVNVYLVGESSSLAQVDVEIVAPTDDLSQSTCVTTKAADQWKLTTSVDEVNLNVALILHRPLVLCENVLNDTNCCPEPLCIVETLRVTACLNGQLSATLLIQVEIYVNSTFHGILNETKILIPDQKHHPLGPCPCNLTARACDVRCCCDKECSPRMIQLFHSDCFPGVFGGEVAQPFDQLCSVQNAVDAPDWFPFLCVQSSLANSPYLGLFYEGDTVKVSSDLSFWAVTPPVAHIPVGYHQGDPIVKNDDEYLIIPQRSLNGQCLKNAPVAYLEDFDTLCVSPLTAAACTGFHGLGDDIENGQGLLIPTVVTYQKSTDLSNFYQKSTDLSNFTTLEPSPTSQSLFPELQDLSTSLELVSKSDPKLLNEMCENMILGAEYVFSWKGNMISNVTLLVTVGNVPLDSPATLTQRFSATFINSVTDHPPTVTWSGNPGYQIGKPVLGAFENGKTLQKAPVSIWQPVGNGLCSSAQTTSVLFGKDAISGCMLRLSVDNFANCSDLRTIVYKGLLNLVPGNISRRGNPNLTDLTEWVPLYKAVIGAIEGVPQREILASEVNFSTVTWQINCGGGDAEACQNHSLPQPFWVSTSVHFIQVPAEPEPKKTRFQMNYFEYDCSRNDVCWPELAFPLTRSYTGETYSQSIAQAMLLVIIFLVTAVLGDPWDKIRKAWNSTTFY